MHLAEEERPEAVAVHWPVRRRPRVEVAGVIPLGLGGLQDVPQRLRHDSAVLAAPGLIPGRHERQRGQAVDRHVALVVSTTEGAVAATGEVLQSVVDGRVGCGGDHALRGAAIGQRARLFSPVAGASKRGPADRQHTQAAARQKLASRPHNDLLTEEIPTPKSEIPTLTNTRSRTPNDGLFGFGIWELFLSATLLRDDAVVLLGQVVVLLNELLFDLLVHQGPLLLRQMAPLLEGAVGRIVPPCGSARRTSATRGVAGAGVLLSAGDVFPPLAAITTACAPPPLAALGGSLSLPSRRTALAARHAALPTLPALVVLVLVVLVVLVVVILGALDQGVDVLEDLLLQLARVLAQFALLDALLRSPGVASNPLQDLQFVALAARELQVVLGIKPLLLVELRPGRLLRLLHRVVRRVGLRLGFLRLLRLCRRLFLCWTFLPLEAHRVVLLVVPRRLRGRPPCPAVGG